MQHATPRISVISKKAGAAAMAAVLAVSMCPGIGASRVAYAAPTAAEKQAEAEQALANLNAMQETLDRLSAEYGEALAAQEEAESNRDAAEARLGELNDQIADLQGRLSDRAREMYRSGGVSFIEILLGASTFEEFATSWDMLNKVNENDAAMVQQRKDLADEAEEQAAIFNDQAIVAAQKSQEAAAAEEQAQVTVAEMQATYDSLSEEAARLLEEERKAQEEAERARAAAIVAASAAAAAQENAAAGNGGGAKKQKRTTAAAGAAPSTVSNEIDGADTTATAAATVDEAVEDEATVDEATDETADETAAAAYEGGSDTVSRAYACLGAPYVWGGVGPNGYDCSGLVSYCLTGSHTRLGTTYTFMNWPTVSDPQPGDIAVNSGHTGVYIGDGQMIHAATYGVGVIIGPVQSGMKIVRWQG